MEKISISNVVEFRRKSERSKSTFVNNLKKPKQENSSGGGNYWITSISAVSNFYRGDDTEIILDKLNELLEKLGTATATATKNMYQKNIEILHNFEDFDFGEMKPVEDYDFVSKRNNHSIVTIKTIPVQVVPNHVFTFQEDGKDHVGAILFVAKKNGYEAEELAIFADALQRYLKKNYSEKHEISSKLCLVVDVVSLNSVNYGQIEKNEMNSSLEFTLDSIKNLL